MLNKKLEWKDNSYEPGLFTFYKDTESLSPLNSNPEKPPKGKDQLHKIKIKANVRKNHNQKRYETQYMYWSIQKSVKGKEKVQIPMKRVNTCEKNVLTRFLQGQPEKPLQQFLTKQSFLDQGRRLNNKSQIELKRKNVNDLFKYDLYRDRTRRFIYRGQGEGEQSKMQKTHILVNKSIESKEEQKRWKIKINKMKERVSKGPQTNIYCNFVQLLVQKRKKQLHQRLNDKNIHFRDLKFKRLQLESKLPTNFQNKMKTQR